MSTTDDDWTKPAALAIPKEGYFELERGRYGPVFPRTPACYGFSIIAKVKEGREVAVFGLSHPVWVEAVVAAVVLRDGATLSEDDVLAHCREHLAGFKTPKQVFFVDSLPKNPSGKLLKRDLRERFSLETSIH